MLLGGYGKIHIVNQFLVDFEENKGHNPDGPDHDGPKPPVHIHLLAPVQSDKQKDSWIQDEQVTLIIFIQIISFEDHKAHRHDGSHHDSS